MALNLNKLLKLSVQANASDVHLKTGLPAMFRVDGALMPLKESERLTPEEGARLAYSLMSPPQKQHFEEENEIDIGYGIPGVGRFRVNIFRQRGTVGMVFRVIPFKIATLDDLKLPKVIEKISMERRGLILVTGTTGSGKSSTMAAMIDFINSRRTGHILTIEDPIEYLIRDKRCVVSQREIGVDTNNFPRALRAALRQDPDVILVGEIRDMETIETALTAAETGHLVLSTLHTLDAAETINRITGIFPPHQQKQIRLQLAAVLRGVISQRLVPKADGKGRVPACEILRASNRIREMIEDEERTRELTQAISGGHTAYGMQTFDQSLMSLYTNKFITYNEAMKQSSNPDDFALRVQGISSTSDTSWNDFDMSDPDKSEEDKVKEMRVGSKSTSLEGDEEEFSLERF